VAEQTAQLRGERYVEAARVLGCSSTRIFRVHILPKLFVTLAISTGATASYVVGLEGVLSYVGLGPTGIVSWGSLLGLAARDGGVPTGLAVASAVSIVASTLALYVVCRPSSR
jgi:peptide/nickel transport system permease protein